jgi:hypothetical protein
MDICPLIINYIALRGKLPLYFCLISDNSRLRKNSIRHQPDKGLSRWKWVFLLFLVMDGQEFFSKARLNHLPKFLSAEQTAIV